MGYIYKITNTINDKIYIGQTCTSIQYRWYGHKKDALSYRRNGHLQNAIRKYGFENFNIEEIEECDSDKLNEREMYWIKYYDSYNNGYNSNIGGDGLHKYNEKEIYKLWDEGLTFKEIKEKLKISKKHLRKILETYPPFIAQRDERYKLSRSRMTSQSRPVEQYSLNGQFIQEFPSIAEASRKTGAHKMAIVHSCQENYRIAGGYRWKYVNKNDDIPFKARKKPVLQYDLKGNLLNTFESLTEAAKETNVNLSSLSQAVKNGVKYRGFLWKPA